MSNISTRKRKKRREIARQVARELRSAGTYRLDGRRIRHFRDPHYEDQMKRKLVRRLQRYLGYPVTVSAVRSGTKLIAYEIRMREYVRQPA